MDLRINAAEEAAEFAPGHRVTDVLDGGAAGLHWRTGGRSQWG